LATTRAAGRDKRCEPKVRGAFCLLFTHRQRGDEVGPERAQYIEHVTILLRLRSAGKVAHRRIPKPSQPSHDRAFLYGDRGLARQQCLRSRTIAHRDPNRESLTLERMAERGADQVVDGERKVPVGLMSEVHGPPALLVAWNEREVADESGYADAEDHELRGGVHVDLQRVR